MTIGKVTLVSAGPGDLDLLTIKAAKALAVADILLLDWNTLDADKLRPDLDPLDLLFARSTARHIKELIVAGRSIVRDGRVLGIDHAAMNEDLLARFRYGRAQNATLAAALPDLEHVVRGHFETPCC